MCSEIEFRIKRAYLQVKFDCDSVEPHTAVKELTAHYFFLVLPTQYIIYLGHPLPMSSNSEGYTSLHLS